MSAIFTFLGGGAFRAIWGEVSPYFTKRQDAKLELERTRLQGELDAAQHIRSMESIRVQAELGVKTIQVQADADVARTDSEAFREAMARAAAPSGIKWVDAWNGTVRPAFATVALALWGWYEFQHMYLNAWVISAWSMEFIGTVAGFYFADRTLRKLGK